MKVRQRLKANAVLLGITVLIVSFILSVSLYRINKATNSAKIAGDIVLKSFERVTFRNDYFRNNNERAKIQWFAKNEEIGRILKAASEYFQSSEDKKTIDELLNNYESLTKIFASMVENRDKKKETKDDAVISEEVEDRLLSQLDIKAYQQVLYARKLLESSRHASNSILWQTGAGIFCSFLVLLTAVTINSWTMGRAITERIRKLRDGASLIGGGNLDHRIDLKGDDEFVELSHDFNTMAANLKTSYYDLEREIKERKQAEMDVLKLSEDMAARNVELESLNKELEAFIYSVSHDLRSPLRSMSAFVSFLSEEYAERLDEQANDYLRRINQSSAKMSKLIEDLLNLSRLSRQEINRTEVDLSAQAASIFSGYRVASSGRNVEISIKEGAVAATDPALMEIVLSNLIGNAWKFTSKTRDARIEFGTLEKDGQTVYYVRDNGAGFDAEYAATMFQPFHRFHSGDEFEGTGIGLSIVERIVRRLGGKVWAEGETGKGATIYFTLG